MKILLLQEHILCGNNPTIFNVIFGLIFVQGLP